MTLTITSLERAGRWFLESGIQEASGGVARYYRQDLARNAHVSTEITGYAVSALVYLHQRTGRGDFLEAAARGAGYLCTAVLKVRGDRGDVPLCRANVSSRRQEIGEAPGVYLGLALDPEASAQAAFKVGRSGALPGQVKAQIEAAASGVSLAPEMIFDQRATFRYLSNIAIQTLGFFSQW